MANKTAPLLLKALIDITELHSFKLLKGSSGRNNIRYMSSCGILATRCASLPVSPAVGTLVCPPSCSFVSLAVPLVNRRMEYSESRNLRYSPEQMYNLVVSVDKYHQFVPWCKKSKVMRGQSGDVKAQLEIGFPPIVERYTSDVAVVPNHQVRAVCTDSSLFSHLETVWRFGGAPNQPNSCNVEFYVCFEFKSMLHTQLAVVFFDEVVKQMVNAFEKRADRLYGPKTTQ
ncbi:coenzyme Q-binding protein COQ10 homolog, mitochondrial-like [Megalops cyprinoides]|uniref:coenzyme Q-binding protein COQ10 homolog, mitochondrial-like n=1 Tax=Megalops cyprinoides TaxID=118141 RepID=UPI001863A3E5|nr:coenzyme Q-binding protein COQ10 homolog, mitochondrial-like [Megalops cyprinoides]